MGPLPDSVSRDSLCVVGKSLGRLSVKRPENNPSPQLSTAQARQLVDHIHANLDGDLRLFELAKLVQFSPRQFFRIFANTFGTTPHQFIMKERVDRAKNLLSQGLLLVEIASALGFASQSHFSGAFRRATGMSPGRFRRVCIGRGISVAGIQRERTRHIQPITVSPSPEH
jgi:transcriptional regulator GlxA family with amidase domain